MLSNSKWNENGTGPINRDKEGNVYFVSLSNGRAYKLNSQTQTLTYVEGVRGTKDGLVVDPNGNVWITETSGTLAKINFSK